MTAPAHTDTQQPPATATSALVWLRRDLRCDDHAALFHALRRYPRVYCAFVFDTDILDALPATPGWRMVSIGIGIVSLPARR